MPLPAVAILLAGLVGVAVVGSVIDAFDFGIAVATKDPVAALVTPGPTSTDAADPAATQADPGASRGATSPASSPASSSVPGALPTPQPTAPPQPTSLPATAEPAPKPTPTPTPKPTLKPTLKPTPEPTTPPVDTAAKFRSRVTAGAATARSLADEIEADTGAKDFDGVAAKAAQLGELAGTEIDWLQANDPLPCYAGPHKNAIAAYSAIGNSASAMATAAKTADAKAITAEIAKVRAAADDLAMYVEQAKGC